MFQFNYFARPIQWRGDRAPAAPDPRDKLVLSWAEHCIECAAPSCYACCDLFAPTEDGKCRRIENGLVPVINGHRGGVEIRFKRWGKLEAQGNATLIPASKAHQVERLAALGARQVHWLGRMIRRFSDTPRWATAHEAFFKRVNAWLEGRRKPTDPVPNLLVLAAENLEQFPCDLLLNIAVDKTRLTRDLTASQLPPPVSIPINLAPGTNSQTVPLTEAASIFECGLPFNFSLAPLGAATPHLILFELEIVLDPALAAQPADQVVAEFKTPAKLVVFDLDNTLWDGVLLEGKVRLRDGIRDLFIELDERGILLSVASKNAEADAMEWLASFGLDGFLLFPQVGWLPKSRSIKTIVDTIDIGIESVIFVDDNPFERAEVNAVHPQVEVLDDQSIATLRDHPRLQGAKTLESRARRKMYQEAVVRTQAASSFGEDYLEFLRSCELVLTIRPDVPADHDRIAELVQRTNQLNFSGRKYDRAALAAALQDDRIHLVIECSDRFGSYGTVGFCMAHFDDGGGALRVIVDDFMLSCRVQGKFIEQALIHHLLGMAGDGAAEVIIDFHKTDRNRPAQLVLEEIGFTAGATGGYSLDPRQVDLSVPFMTVRTI